MSRPQQPELERTPDRGEVDQEGRYATRQPAEERRESGRRGKVPEENRPGHRPDRDQDKPFPAPRPDQTG